MKIEKMGATEGIASFIHDTKFENLPKEAIEKTKLSFLDTLGVALAASGEEAVDILLAVVQEIKGEEQATILGRGLRTSTLNAAMVNGTMSHLYDFDDTNWGAVIHPSGSVFASALAISEWKKLGGRDFITASTVGLEVSIRIGLSIAPFHHTAGFHTTGTCGTFGATAASAKLLRLNHEKITNAIGTAGTQAAGLRVVKGSMCKGFHEGKAAMNGVLSSLLAEKGFTSSKKILEDKRGFCRVFSSECDLGKITDEIGKKFEFIKTSTKKYASCHETHAPIDAMIEILDKHNVEPNEIEEIELHVFPIMWDVAYIDHPTSGLEGKFSLPHSLAVAVVDRKAGIAQFTDQKVHDPKISQTAKKVKIFTDLKTTSNFEREVYRSARVVIKTRDGKKYDSFVSPEKSPTPEAIINKFEDLATPVLSAERTEKIVKLVKELEKVDDMSKLVQLLR